MGAAQGFVNDPVDESEFFQTAGSDTHRFGGIGGLVGTLPQNRCATFRRYHRIGTVLQHQQAIADTDGQGTTRTTFTDNGTDDRRLQ